jgi:hypothetical protein
MSLIPQSGAAAQCVAARYPALSSVGLRAVARRSANRIVSRG